MIDHLPEPVARLAADLLESNHRPVIAYLPHPERYRLFSGLTVGDCEQVAEYETRAARRAIARFERGGRRATAWSKRAAEAVFRAVHARMRFCELLGEPVGDLPFGVKVRATP
ncbi:MAG: hypothetical protein NTW96_01870 [Planctomycetia bacterium]|nr:hypothetical protein [Planctomycetia bacterium]